MAQLIVAGDELVAILRVNGLVPAEVQEVEIAGAEIKLRVRTPWPILKSVPVHLRFVGFEGGCMVLQLQTNRLIDKFGWLVDKMLATVPLADHGARWEYPQLHVDVNLLLARQVRGVEVTDIVLDDGYFHISAAGVKQAGPDAEGPEDATDSS